MSNSRPFVTLDPELIKKDYSKTWKSIKEWLEKCATEGQVFTEEMMKAFIYGNPRFLYDYFDDMGMVLLPNLENHKSRKEAEEATFNQAFKDQEEKL